MEDKIHYIKELWHPGPKVLIIWCFPEMFTKLFHGFVGKLSGYVTKPLSRPVKKLKPGLVTCRSSALYVQIILLNREEEERVDLRCLLQLTGSHQLAGCLHRTH